MGYQTAPIGPIGERNTLRRNGVLLRADFFLFLGQFISRYSMFYFFQFLLKAKPQSCHQAGVFSSRRRTECSAKTSGPSESALTEVFDRDVKLADRLCLY